jgi:REP element-mobilizing transposase RayT
MPRNKRLQFPGGIYHVIVRGIERRRIFLDDADREEFLIRLENALAKTGCECHAWALMSNHLHLIIRTGKTSLTDMMRKVLTGYAVYFNRKHKRHGYLYQNRYKSILCQEDVYFLQLARYIHLNPLKAKIVSTLEELDVYPWAGHSAILGNVKRAWQNTEWILTKFGHAKSSALKTYRCFIHDGITLEKSEEEAWDRGGLRRSAGGWQGIRVLKKNGEFWRGDQRILGDGDFVRTALKVAEEQEIESETLKRQGWDMNKLCEKTCALFSLKSDELKKKGRSNVISDAKNLLCCLANQKLKISGSVIARFLGISRPAVSKNVLKGEKWLKNNPTVLHSIISY